MDVVSCVRHIAFERPVSNEELAREAFKKVKIKQINSFTQTPTPTQTTTHTHRCHYTIGRHSKSFKTDKYFCGKCAGRFELQGKSQQPLTPFAKFVQENYSAAKRRVKEKAADPAAYTKHKHVMRSLGEQFRAAKISDANRGDASNVAAEEGASK